MRIDHRNLAPDIGEMMLFPTHRHDFALPLEEGELRLRFLLHVDPPSKPEPDYSVENNIYYAHHAPLTFSFYNRKGIYPDMRCEIMGGGEEEELIINRREKSPVTITRETWHTLRLNVHEGQAELFIDDKPAAKVRTKGITALGIGSSWRSQALIDDLEILHRDSPQNLRAKMRQEWTRNDMAESRDADWVRKTFLKTPEIKYGERKVPPDCSPEKPLIADKFSRICIDTPILPEGDLVLESVEEPGVMINITDRFRGKIAFGYPCGAFNFGDLFGRNESMCSSFILDVRARLVNEYAPKGVEFFSVSSDNRHYHILPYSSYEERREIALTQREFRRTPGYAPRAPLATELLVMDTNDGRYNRWARLQPAFGCKIGTRMSSIMDEKGQIFIAEPPRRRLPLLWTPRFA